MSEPELPQHLTERLTAALTAGVPLKASLPSQARYAKPALSGAYQAPMRPRVLAVAAASALVLAAIALAGSQQQSRRWIIETVGNVAHDIGVPLTGSPQEPNKPSTHRPSPVKPGGSPTSNPPKAAESPEPTQTPGATPPAAIDEPSPSPVAEPPDGDVSATPPTPSPVPSPSPGDEP
jgi:hypothetical protein